MVVINIKHKNIQIITNKINAIPSTLFLDLSNKPHMIESGFSGYLESLCQTRFLPPGLNFLIYKWIWKRTGSQER